MIKKTVRFMIVAVLLGSLPTFGQQLRSAAEPGYPPLSDITTDGRPTGFSVELLQKTVEAIGQSVTFETGTWSHIKSELTAGKLDVLPVVARTPGREAVFDFTTSYLTLHGALFVRDNETAIQGLVDLSGRTIAVMAADSADEYVSRTCLSDRVIRTETFEEAFQMLSDGRADAVIAQKLMGVTLVKELSLSNIKVVGKPNEEFKQEMCFAVPKGKTKVLHWLNEGLAIINKNGTARQLEKKWLGSARYEAAVARTLIYAGDHDFYPFEFIDKQGRPAGFNIDLIRALSRQTGINIVLELSPWSQVRQKADSGRLDLVTMYYSDDRTSLLDFASPLLLSHQAVFARDDSPRYDSRDALKNRRVTVVEGDMTHDFAIKQNLSSHLIPVPDPQQALALLQKGEVDFAICSMIQGNHWIQENRWNNLHVAEPRLVSLEYCLAVPRGRTELLNLINTGLAELHASGEYRQIHTQWLAPLDDSTNWSRIQNYFIFTVCGFLLIATGVFVWIIFLKKEVRKQTFNLHAVNLRFNIAVQAGGIGVWDLDLITHQLVWDDRMYGIYGVSKKTFSGAYEAWKHCVHPDDLESADAEITAAMDGEKNFSTSFRIIRPNGKIRHIRAHANVLYGKDGHPERMIGTNQDITDQIKAREDLTRSEQAFRELADTLPLAIVLFRKEDEANEYINPTFENMFGYTIKDIPSLAAWWPLAYPDETYRSEVCEEWTRKMEIALKTGNPIDPTETLVTCRDGTTKTILWSYTAMGEKSYACGLDLTEQKRTTEKLANSAMHLRLAQSTARIGSWEQDRATDELFWSDMVYQLFGLEHKKNKLTVEQFFEIVHPDDRERVNEAFQGSLKFSGASYDITHRIIRSDSGEVRFIRERCTHFRDAGKNIIKSIGTVQDVTEHEQAEMELNQSRKLIRDVIDALPEMLWLKDAKGAYLLCNQEFAKLVNVKKTEIPGLTDYDLFPKEKADFYRKHDQLAMQSKATTVNEESADYDADGYSLWIETLKTPVYGNEGKLIGILGIGRDISRRKEALQESQEKQEFLNQVVDQSPIPMYITSPNKTALRCNQAVRDLWNLPPEQSIAKYSLLNDDNLKSPQIAKKIEQTQTDKQAARYELHWDPKKVHGVDFGKTGRIWLDISVFPLLNIKKEITHLVVQMVDITDQKKMEENLARQQLDLENEVIERTKELRQIVNAMAGRENRMADLKLMNKRLCAQLEDAGMTAQDSDAKEDSRLSDH